MQGLENPVTLELIAKDLVNYFQNSTDTKQYSSFANLLDLLQEEHAALTNTYTLAAPLHYISGSRQYAADLNTFIVDVKQALEKKSDIVICAFEVLDKMKVFFAKSAWVKNSFNIKLVCELFKYSNKDLLNANSEKSLMKLLRENAGKDFMKEFDVALGAAKSQHAVNTIADVQRKAAAYVPVQCKTVKFAQQNDAVVDVEMPISSQESGLDLFPYDMRLKYPSTSIQSFSFPSLLAKKSDSSSSTCSSSPIHTVKSSEPQFLQRPPYSPVLTFRKISAGLKEFATEVYNEITTGVDDRGAGDDEADVALKNVIGQAMSRPHVAGMQAEFDDATDIHHDASHPYAAHNLFG